MISTRSGVGFIGLGTMGGAMAARLVEAGHRVTGFDVDENALEALQVRGGHAMLGPDTAAADAGVVVVMVKDAEQADHALFGARGAVRAMARGAVVWLATTVPARYAQELEGRLAEHHLLLVDGPVSGGLVKALDGTLTVVAGGSAEAVDKARIVMSACAAEIRHVGPAGAASTVKMINQLLAASHIALTAEALSLAIASGVDPTMVVDVVACSSGTSLQFEKRAPRMIAAEHAPHATVGIWLKDLDIALAAASSLGTPAPLATAARGVFAAAAELGHGAASDTLLLDVYQRLARPGDPSPGQSSAPPSVQPAAPSSTPRD